MPRKGKNGMIYNDDVQYSILKKHRYKDAPGYVFYECPICHREYLPNLISHVGWRDMCIDCEQNTDETDYY